MRSKLIVSRHWHKPEIETYITKEEVGSRIDLDDFLTALVEEIGNPTMLLTKTALRARLEAASIVVIHELKQATIQIV